VRTACFITQEQKEVRVSERLYNVLFLCTGNSARSVLAESILNHLAGRRFRGFSAGSHPKGAVHPMTLQLLSQLDLPTDGLRSKSWDEFAKPGAPAMDFIFTVCDQAAGEMCPVWPGKPITGHWSIPDPAAAVGTDAERMQAFRDAFKMLETRISLFVNLRLDTVEPVKLRTQLDEIERYHQDSGK
jgi:arsenate reductase